MKLMLAQNTAQQRAAARTEQQAQRRAAACEDSLASAGPGKHPGGGRNGRQANPCADGKGAGGKHPGAACDNL